MARPRYSIIEYRNYDFPGSLPIQIHNRMNWKISSVRSSRLHIHNCFEIGLCLSGSGRMNFCEEEVPFRGGDGHFFACEDNRDGGDGDWFCKLLIINYFPMQCLEKIL